MEQRQRETKQVAFRLDVELLKRIDAYGERVQQRTGARVSRTNAVEALLEMAVDLVEAVDRDPVLAGEPATVRDLVSLALDGVEEARAAQAIPGA